MAAPWPRVLAALAVAVLALGAPTPTAHAADDPVVDVTIDALAPLIPGPDSTLRISGRVANAGSTAVDAVSVRLRIGSRPLTTTADIDAVLAAEVEPSGGSPDDVPLDRTSVDLGGPIGPGEQRAFRLRIETRLLARPQDGVYAVGVEALGRAAGASGDRGRLGVERTVLTLLPSPQQPMGLVWLWPLADRPARDADGVFLDDALPRALATDGRLGQLVGIGADHPQLVTWIADPELLQAAAAVGAGYRVVRGDTVVVGEDPQVGTQWLDDLRRALGSRPLHVLPYADIDASAARRADMSTDVVRAVTSASPVGEVGLGRPVQARLAWAPSGGYERRTADLLANAGVRTMVLSASALPSATDDPRSGIADLGTEIGPVDAVLVDDGLARILGSAATTAAEAVQVRQRFLAHTGMLAMAASTPITTVAAPANLRWAPSPALLEELLTATERAPWLRPTTLESLLDEPRAATDRARYRAEQREAELPTAYLATVARAQERVDQLAGVLDDEAGAVAPFTAALLRAQSAAWRTDLTTARTLVRRINAELDARIALVRVLSTGTVTFSGDSGNVPVTIANDSPATVTVGLALVGNPPSRLMAQPLTDITVEPGRKVSVEVPARVLGGQAITVNVQLRTMDGLDYGDPAQITLTSTAYARAAAWVMGAAFVGIAIFVVIGVTRRIRSARRGARADRSGSVSP